MITAGLAAPSAAAATAYTIEPLNYNLVTTTPTLFGGAVCVTYDCEKVPTAAALDLSHQRGVFGERGPISAGARTLNDRLTADPDEKLVFGFSQGAQIAGFWLRNYAPTTTVSPQNTSFLLVGDPENTYGVPWAPRVPTNTGFDVTELWAQYDGWADWPDRFDLLAIANAVYGMFFVHPTAYDDLDLATAEADGSVVTWQTNGITYKMVVDETLPILDPLRNLGLGFIADMVNDSWRAHIEKQYDRPSTQDEADEMFGAPAEDAPAEDDTAEDDTAETARSVSRKADDLDADEPDDEAVRPAARAEALTSSRRATATDTTDESEAEDADDDEGPSRAARPTVKSVDQEKKAVDGSAREVKTDSGDKDGKPGGDKDSED
ncbi:hypothetical protein BHQ18_14475 [Mycolicibacterium flavescens]|uniref:PE-PPE domain-containing protein n=2 Tax=Mycolicibacterium flavescens TaxID=1776 RepID=A0A1E3RJG2_MYCFV|nr:hypothetical protein BHQ18_14475 [Mycolicibacterium flavescens]